MTHGRRPHHGSQVLTEPAPAAIATDYLMDPIALRASDDPAVLTADGRRLTHRDLLRLADRFSTIFPDDRKVLVGLLGDRELGSVAAHVAALRTGHAVAWLGAARDPHQQLALINRYEPDVVVGPAALVAPVVAAGRYTAPAATIADVEVATVSTRPPEVGPNTSVLLLTSGSLSGGRAVRLSAESVAANTSGITAALGVRSDSRAATSLPLFYTYGLSVLNSHLAAGGSIVLTAAPATGAQFWQQFADTECGTFAGVPLQYDWLRRSRLPWFEAPALRTMTVSGGRIHSSLARDLHRQCDGSGRRFYKMYGQTEATARITVLQHEDFPAHSESVGTVIAGGDITIERESGAGHEDPRVGRIVYRGLSAMQGYAEDRADLGEPDQMHGRVDTGDLGYLEGGFLHLVGRDGRFIKPDGKRVALDALEDVFAELAPAAVIGSPDDRAHVFVESSRTEAIADLRNALLGQLSVGPIAIQLHFMDSLPRRANGKIDYGALRDQVAAPN